MKRMAEVEASALPSLVFDVKSTSGKLLGDVRISVDGMPAVEASATAMAVDPGAHKVRFETPGQPPPLGRDVWSLSSKGAAGKRCVVAGPWVPSPNMKHRKEDSSC